MAVIIRLSRSGKKHSPVYRILVQDKERHPKKTFLENVGNFYPLNQQNPKDKNFSCDVGRIQYWISKGAQCTDRVKSLLKKNGIDFTGTSTLTSQATTSPTPG